MWILEKAVPSDYSVSMTVALKVDPERRAALEKTFWEVSDPKHEKYGQHLSIDDITKLLAIPDERVAPVVKYFTEAGATSVEVAPNKDMITIDMPAAAAELALNMKLAFFTHSERTHVQIVRA